MTPEDDADNSTERPAPITLAVDAMGGNNAPGEVVAAVAQASTERRSGRPVFFILVGDETRLTDALLEHGHNPERIRIRHAPEVVDPGESAKQALTEKTGCSIDVACQLVAEGRADGVVTAGHPGAAVLSGKRHLKRVPGTEHAALCSVYPTPRERGPKGDRFSLLLDVGASHSATADDLHSFALMGSAYSRVVSGLEHPRVSLLSTAAESGAGPPEVRRAAKMIGKDDRLNFFGCCEGHDIPNGRADVVVCNGYVGNVTIKILEGVSEAAFDLARAAYDEKLLWRMGLRMLSGGLDQLKRMTDFEEYGGAPVLGFEGVMIVAHARSGRKAIANALRLAIKNTKSELPDRIHQLLTD